jgi:hypothetical protein
MDHLSYSCLLIFSDGGNVPFSHQHIALRSPGHKPLVPGGLDDRWHERLRRRKSIPLSGKEEFLLCTHTVLFKATFVLVESLRANDV